MEAALNKTNNLRMGEYLIKQGLIDDNILNQALSEQSKTGSPLGLILAKQGSITSKSIQENIARRDGIEYFDINKDYLDKNLLASAYSNDYVTIGYLPVSMKGDRLQVAVCMVDEELRKYLQSEYGREIDFLITSPFDIIWAIEKHLGVELDYEAREALFQQYPIRSARHRLTSRITTPLLLLLMALPFFLWPAISAIVTIIMLNIFYLGTISLKVILFIAGYFYRKRDESYNIVEITDDNDLPIYTVLIPLYKEHESIPRLLYALRRLDYPKSKLDIKLIVESDDKETIKAIKAQKPEAIFEIIHVPYSLPRTKPKACNFAMNFAKGSYVVIYDAEDVPDADQLKKSIAVFKAMSWKYPNLACLQARLGYYNRNDNLLTRFFAIEYSFLFDFMHPGLARLKMPILLGGTSNHLARHHLEKSGGWDPYNVTEDADLGIRLGVEDCMTLPLDSNTMEEAPISVWVWIKQRSRWVKGYIQTWRVYLRKPSELTNKYGFWRFIGLQTFLGGASMVYLVSPFLWAISLSHATGLNMEMSAIPESFSGFIFDVCIVVMIFAVSVQWLLSIWVVRSKKWNDMWVAVFLYPLYWALHVLASMLALWDIIFNPYGWRKTPHGLSKMS